MAVMMTMILDHREVWLLVQAPKKVCLYLCFLLFLGVSLCLSGCDDDDEGSSSRSLAAGSGTEEGLSLSAFVPSVVFLVVFLFLLSDF